MPQARFDIHYDHIVSNDIVRVRKEGPTRLESEFRFNFASSFADERVYILRAVLRRNEDRG